MRRAVLSSLSLLTALPSSARSQAVSIPNVDPPAVVSVLKADLAPLGFTLDHSGKKDAVFRLDRGNQIQNNGMVVHVHLEVHTWFKKQADTLVVTAGEEAVGEATQGMDFRKPVDTPSDVARLQQMLETVKSEVLARADSAARRDSSATRRDTTHG